MALCDMCTLLFPSPGLMYMYTFGNHNKPLSPISVCFIWQTFSEVSFRPTRKSKQYYKSFIFYYGILHHQNFQFCFFSLKSQDQHFTNKSKQNFRTIGRQYYQRTFSFRNFLCFFGSEKCEGVKFIRKVFQFIFLIIFFLLLSFFVFGKKNL
jgi:hypothetical protein